MGRLKNSDISTSDTIELLYTLNKTRYAKLRSEHPEQEHLLLLGEAAGDSDISSKELLIKAELTATTLKEVKEASLNYFKKIKSKLDNYKRVEFISQLIAAVGGSSLLVTLTTKFENNQGIQSTLQILGAVIATAGSLFAVYLNKGLGAWSFNNRNYNNDYHNLLLHKVEAESLLEDIIPKIKSFDKNSNYSALQDLIVKANNLSKKVKLIIPHYD